MNFFRLTSRVRGCPRAAARVGLGGPRSKWSSNSSSCSSSSSNSSVGGAFYFPLNPKTTNPQTLNPRVAGVPTLRCSPLRGLVGVQLPFNRAAAAAAAAAGGSAPAAFRSLTNSSHSSSSSSSSSAAPGAANSSSPATAAATEAAEAAEGAGVAAGGRGANELEEEAAGEQEDEIEDREQLKEALAAAREATKNLEENNANLKDKLLRCLAEQENARVRFSKEVASVKDYAISGFAKALLDVGDSLGQARQQLQEQLEKQQQLLQQQQQQQPQQQEILNQMKQFVDGISLTDSLFHRTLEKFGVEQYDPMGEKFDPALHEALFEMDGPEDKKGKIAQVVQSGYRIKDRILRAAKVGVVKP
ncbi:co-chaperone GrpE, putative [Eimeria brunetti]|uniref:Co-chaperone GrpE, putative n=1 Tax=Eimeria brunetti TaxID=51314 RepID=U6LBZ6_9EIME|nr:co-chaperone GrpE, putative [Eimeria brunetti]